MEPTPRHFLDVTASVTGRAWIDRLDDQMARTAQAIAQRSGISEILARIIAARGVGIDAAAEYLNPTIRGLMPDPSTLADMDALAARLVEAITDNEKVALFGDYDVDGASSCALMARYLAPFRPRPGGLYSRPHLRGLRPQHRRHRQADRRRRHADRHARLRHHQRRRRSPMRGRAASMCWSSTTIWPTTSCRPPMRWSIRTAPTTSRGSAISAPPASPSWCWSPSTGLLRQRGDTGQPDLMQLLDIVALATVCDVVPLTGLNRAFVRARPRGGAAAGQSRHRRAGAGGARHRPAQSLSSRLPHRPAHQCRRPHRRCGARHAAARRSTTSTRRW